MLVISKQQKHKLYWPEQSCLSWFCSFRSEECLSMIWQAFHCMCLWMFSGWSFFFLMPVIMDRLVLAIWPLPAHNIFRSYITEDTLCFSFFLCLCEVMVSKLGCNYISGIINGIAYMFLYAFNELSKKWIVELPVSLSTFPWLFPCSLSYTLISYVDQIRM